MLTIGQEMTTRERILEYLQTHNQLNGRELSDLLGVSRQAVNRHLKELVQAGQVVKSGTTRAATYQIAGRSAASTSRQRRDRYRLQGLEEDRVLGETDSRLQISAGTSESAWSIFAYAFSEMLNNAIDHSESDEAEIEVEVGAYDVRFRVRDYGIGVFHSIASKFQLSGEDVAVGELIKGKTTTMKERHSGEGIFFTSRCADRMTIRSHRIELVFDNERRDMVVNEKRFQEGTQVDFRISRRTRRKLADVFEAFAPEEFGFRFERTRVLVNLFEADYVSRSEARRLMSGLSRFTEVCLDFDKVKTMGQGFADEVFRVFLNAHPDIHIKVENLAPPLHTMVLHVIDKESEARLTVV